MTIPPGKYSTKELAWFKAVFDTYYESIRSFAYYKTGDVNLADDIVQDVFLKLWSIRQKVEDHTVKALLYTMAANMAKNHFKHQKVVYQFQLDRSGERSAGAPDETIRMEQFNQQLQEALAALPSDQREVFLMNRIDGLPYREIAERLDISIKAVEKRMSEALKMLRKRFNYRI